MKKRIRIIPNTGLNIGEIDKEKDEDYAKMPTDYFLKAFFPQTCEYFFVDETEPADICCYGISMKDEDELRDNEVNILINIENVEYWASQPRKILNNKEWMATKYHFINKHKHFGSSKTDIFIHNDKSIFTLNNKTHQFCVPTILCRIQHFNIVENNYNDLIPDIPFENKKLILFMSFPQKRRVTTSILNKNFMEFYNTLKKNGAEVDNILKYNVDLKHVTCYNSIELLKIMNQYKFIVTFENSSSNGYITEKIFNTFLAKCIPIYNGAPNISDFINPDSFILFDKNTINKMKMVSSNKSIFDSIVSQKKIQPKYQNFKLNYE